MASVESSRSMGEPRSVRPEINSIAQAAPCRTTPACARHDGRVLRSITAGRATAIVTMHSVMANSKVAMSRCMEKRNATANDVARRHCLGRPAGSKPSARRNPE